MHPSSPTNQPPENSVRQGLWCFQWHQLALIWFIFLAIPSLFAPSLINAQEADVGRLFREAMRLIRSGQAVQGEIKLREVVRRTPGHYAGQYNLALLYQRNNPTQALKHAERARSVRPASDEIHYLIGQLQERKGMFSNAAESYRQAIRLNARHYSANKRLRGVLRQIRAKKSVVERAGDAFDRNPSVGSLTLFGKIVMNSNDPKQALWEFEQLREQYPKLPEINLWIARAQRKLGSLAGEIAAYEEYLGHNDQAWGVRLVLFERLVEAGEFRKAGQRRETLKGHIQTPKFNTGDAARFYFSESRYLMAGGKISDASVALFRSAEKGFNHTRVESTFRKDTERYPENGDLWFYYGQWLQKIQRWQAAAQAYLEAGRRASERRRTARAALRDIASQAPDEKTLAIAIGELAWADKDASEAISWLEKIPVGDPADRRAALLLGLIFQKQQNVERSLEYLMRYVLSYQDRKGIAFARGNVFWEMGRRDVALRMWDQHRDQLDAYPEVIPRLIVHYEATGQKEPELQTRVTWRATHPQDLNNRFRIGQLRFDQGDLKGALSEWEFVAKHKEGDFDLMVRMGRTYLANQNHEKGIEMFRRAAQIKDLEIDDSLRLGEMLLARKRFPEALPIYNRLHQTQPDHPSLIPVLPVLVINTPAPPSLRMAAAGIAQNQGQLELAVEILEDLIKRYPEEIEGRAMLAGLFLVNGEPAEAERILQAGGAGQGISETRRLKLLVQAQERLGKEADSINTYRRLLELEPDPILRRRLGLLMVRYQRGEEAIPYLTETLNSTPDDLEILQALAALDEAAGRTEKLVRGLEKILQLQPGAIPLRRKLIHHYIKTKAWDAVIPHMEATLKMNPLDTKIRYDLISIFLRRFETELARPHYEYLRQNNATLANRLARYFPNKPKAQ